MLVTRISNMNYNILILPFLALFCQAEPMWQPAMGAIPEVIQGGQVFSNLLLVSGSETMAPMADGFIGVLEDVVSQGKRYLSSLSRMMASLDFSPQLASLTNKMHADIQSVESALDDVERSARHSGVVLKATADCVAPKREEIKQIKDETFRELREVIDFQREAIMDLVAAGYSIEEQINHLEDIETKVVRAAASGHIGRAVEVALDNRKEADKEARMIHRAFASAADDYQIVSGKAFKQLGEVLQRVEVDGRRILHEIDLCVMPKLKEKITPKEE